MADHLPLPPGRRLETKRQRPAPTGQRGDLDRTEHASDLKQLMEDVSERAGLADDSDDDYFDPRLVLKIKSSTRIEDGPWTRLNFQVLGEGRDWVYAVLSSRESRQLFGEVLSRYSAAFEGSVDWTEPQNLAAAIDHIQGIELYGPEDRLDAALADLSFAEPEIVDVLLWPSASTEDARGRLDDVRSILSTATESGLSAQELAADDRPLTTLIRASVDRSVLAELSREGWVERIRPQLSVPTTRREVLGAQAPANLPRSAGEPIGLLDGVVVETNPLLAGRVVDSATFPEGYVYGEADLHGTAVASIACWGNLDFVVRGSGDGPEFSAAVYSARVLEERRDGKTVLVGPPHTTVEAAIRWLAEDNDVTVVNCSFNRDRPELDTILRSELTSTIDDLAKELGIVVVVSAGNREESPATGWFDGYPDYLNEADNEVTSPGDAALAVTVGSFARRDVPSAGPGLVAVARAGSPSPLTRTGPVRNHLKHGRAKPEFSADGGNAVHNRLTGWTTRSDPGVSVPVATPPIGNQILTIEEGTSFSAPFVAHEIALIASRYPAASANRLRALAALSARRTEQRQLVGFDMRKASVFGVPDSSLITESGGQQAVLVVDGSMLTNSTVVHELPVPYEFAEGQSSRSLRIALAFDPPVLRSRREYIAGSMSVELVRGLNFEEVSERYSRQPTRAQVEQNPELVRHDLPPRSLRPQLTPGPQRLASSTLIRQDYIDGSWDPDLDHYFVVVTHTRAAWSRRQQQSYVSQDYSLCVQMVDDGRVDLDLHALVQARLQAIAQATVRAQVV